MSVPVYAVSVFQVFELDLADEYFSAARFAYGNAGIDRNFSPFTG